MTDCGCDKARKALEEYLHNELCKEDAADIREHMDNCPECSAEHKVGILLTETIQRVCKEAAPQQLREQVMQRIRQIQSSHS